MREGDVGRVAGIPLDDAARKYEGGTVELVSLSDGRQTTNISDEYPDQWRTVELPREGLPRKGWDTDGDDDAFM